MIDNVVFKLFLIRFCIVLLEKKVICGVIKIFLCLINFNNVLLLMFLLV